MLIVLMILLNSPHSLPPVLPLFPNTETPLIDTPPLHCPAWGTRTAWVWVQRPDCGVSHSNHGQGRLGNVEQVRGARNVLVL